MKPHVTRTFKLSTDTDFEKKFWDVIGLYLDPPDARLSARKKLSAPVIVKP